MTFRLKEFFEALPKHKYNILETARLFGYSDSYAVSHIYDIIRKYQKTGDDESIKDGFIRELKKDIKRFKREQDNTSFLRAKELLSKILGLQIDKSINSTSITVKGTEKEELDELRRGLFELSSNNN